MPYSSEAQCINANNIDVLHTLSEISTTAWSKTWTALDIILNKDQKNAWRDMTWWTTVPRSASGNFRLSQPTPSLLFGGILFFVVEATETACYPFRHEYCRSHRRVKTVSQESEYPFSVNSYWSEYSKIGESGNFYEPGKISSSANLVRVLRPNFCSAWS